MFLVSQKFNALNITHLFLNIFQHGKIASSINSFIFLIRINCHKCKIFIQNFCDEKNFSFRKKVKRIISHKDLLLPGILTKLKSVKKHDFSHESISSHFSSMN